MSDKSEYEKARERLRLRIVARKERLNDQWFRQAKALEAKYKPLIAALDAELEVISEKA